MVEDLEVGIRFDTDQAISDLESDLEDADITAGLGTGGVNVAEGGGGGAASGLAETAGLAEIGSDIGSGAGSAGIAGRLSGALSSISVPLIAIAGLLAAAVGFLALLEPVQQALSFIVSQFELLIIPFISLLTPVLQELNKFITEAIRFFRDPAGTVFGTNRSDRFETAGTSTTTASSRGTSSALGLAATAVFPQASTVLSPMFADLSDEAKKESQANEVEKQEQELFGGVFN